MFCIYAYDENADSWERFAWWDKGQVSYLRSTMLKLACVSRERSFKRKEKGEEN